MGFENLTDAEIIRFVDNRPSSSLEASLADRLDLAINRLKESEEAIKKLTEETEIQTKEINDLRDRLANHGDFA